MPDGQPLQKRSSFSNFTPLTNQNPAGSPGEYDNSGGYSRTSQDQQAKHSMASSSQQHQLQYQNSMDGMHFGGGSYGASYGPPQVYGSDPNSRVGSASSGSKPNSYKYGNGAPQQTSSQSRHSIYDAQQYLPKRAAYFESNWPLYSVDWSYRGTNDADLLAVSTYTEDTSNRIQIIHGFHTDQNGSPSYDFQKASEVNVPYPCTNIAWGPSSLRTPINAMQLITTGDCLRLWNYNAETAQLQQRCALVNKVKSTYMPPVTNFDWNKTDPSIVITSSIDTTCTVWDVNTSVAKTQLIAHDSEVYDAAFVANSVNIFASVGADGSVRVFDLRSLDHSTIIYEPQKPVPLVRVAANPLEENCLAALASKSNEAFALDIRVPGVPIAVLSGHQAPVNSIAWAPAAGGNSSLSRPTAGSSSSRRHILATGGDDCQAILWNLSSAINKPRTPGGPPPSASASSSSSDAMIVSNYADTQEINTVTWNKDATWMGVVSGRGIQGVRV